jgi:curli biogenesis system outer membrane secretion channel CsgG
MLARDTRPVWTGIKKRVGVVHFEDTAQYQGYSGDRRLLAGAAQDVVSEALFQSGAFIVVERERLGQVLSEQGLGQSGIVNQKSAAKVGQVLGLQALITGKITDLNVIKSQSGFGRYYQQGKTRYHARVSVKMIDATSGEIWAQESGEGEADSTSRVVMGGGSLTQDETLGKRALYAAINQTMAKLVAKAANKPWSGVIASVSKGKIYITAGSDIGLQPGTVLSARHLGQEITDPTTGQVLGRETGNVVGKLQVAEHLNERLTVCVSSSGSGFTVGDQVTMDPTQTR